MKTQPHSAPRTLRLAALTLAALLPTTLAAQDPPKKPSDIDIAGRIATQPVRDIGVAKTKIPEVLIEAADAPYSIAGMGSCPALKSAMQDLNGALGPDFSPSLGAKKFSIAKEGGAAVVNSLIPFRNVVREVSGAAAADRRLVAATDAGIARRGFLRGIYQTRRCRGAL